MREPTGAAFSSPLKPGPSSLAALGPSPRSRHRRAKLLHGAWDLFHLGCVAAVSLHIFAADRSTDVLSAANAEPVEALSCCFTNFFLISMCGNSPLAWAAVFALASVDDAAWFAFRDGVVARFGDAYDGHSAYALGTVAFLCFLVPYLVHGFLLLLNIDGEDSKLSCELHHELYSWVGAATNGGYLGSDFRAFFSAVVSGAAGVYFGMLAEDAGISTDLVVTLGQTVSVVGDPSLSAPAWCARRSFVQHPCCIF